MISKEKIAYMYKTDMNQGIDITIAKLQFEAHIHVPADAITAEPTEVILRNQLEHQIFGEARLLMLELYQCIRHSDEARVKWEQLQDHLRIR